MGQYKGLLDEPEGTYNGGKQFKIPNIDFANTPIPQRLDWRDYGKKQKIVLSLQDKYIQYIVISQKF